MQSRYISFFLILAICSLSNSLKLKVQSTDDEPETNAVLKVNCDDHITEIKIDGVPIDLDEYPDAKVWNKPIDVPLKLTPKSIIEISCLNKGTYSYGNPGHLEAVVTYNETNGDEQKIYSNTDDWKCDGKTPVEDTRTFHIPIAKSIWTDPKESSTATCILDLSKFELDDDC